jgi:hypothetical protein
LASELLSADSYQVPSLSDVGSSRREVLGVASKWDRAALDDVRSGKMDEDVWTAHNVVKRLLEENKLGLVNLSDFTPRTSAIQLHQWLRDFDKQLASNHFQLPRLGPSPTSIR